MAPRPRIPESSFDEDEDEVSLISAPHQSRRSSQQKHHHRNSTTRTKRVINDDEDDESNNEYGEGLKQTEDEENQDPATHRVCANKDNDGASTPNGHGIQVAHLVPDNNNKITNETTTPRKNNNQEPHQPLADITKKENISINGITDTMKKVSLGNTNKPSMIPTSPLAGRSIPSPGRSLAHRGSSIRSSSPQPPAAPKQRLVITKLVLVNFKSYAGRQEIGPFHSVS